MLVEINLLGEKERDRPAFVVAAISLILLGLVVGLVFYFLGNSFENKQQEIAAQSAEVVGQQAAIQAQMQTSVSLNDAQKLQKTVEWAETYQFDTLPLIRELTSLLPERGFFANFTFTSPNGALVDVQFDTSREAAFYLTQLKSSEMITVVNLTTLSSQVLEEATVEESDGTTNKVGPESQLMPRYLASYEITFLDTRMPAEGTAVPVDPNAPPVEGEAPAEVTPTDTNETNEEQPAPADDAEGADTNE
ncbi:hypothetical protein [Paenisporosarcina indica]|uniref:hypothetical protein n=1 Tax=Paenisporosarcina indica TaxID=650093 RepID=UPI00094FDDA3|nr:hypothetical protein [Paenisporosarcina indica]